MSPKILRLLAAATVLAGSGLALADNPPPGGQLNAPWMGPTAQVAKSLAPSCTDCTAQTTSNKVTVSAIEATGTTVTFTVRAPRISGLSAGPQLSANVLGVNGTVRVAPSAAPVVDPSGVTMKFTLQTMVPLFAKGDAGACDLAAGMPSGSFDLRSGWSGVYVSASGVYNGAGINSESTLVAICLHAPKCTADQVASCGDHGRCVPSADGSAYGCACLGGYDTSADAHSCVQHNQCNDAGPKAACSAMSADCLQDGFNYKCACPAGTFFDALSNKCGTHTNACGTTAKCVQNAICTENPDRVGVSYTCSCAPGLTMTPGGCLAPHVCRGPNACGAGSCADTYSDANIAPGQVKCLSCPPGTVNTGSACQDIDECTMKSAAAACAPGACVNLDGSRGGPGWWCRNLPGSFAGAPSLNSVWDASGKAWLDPATSPGTGLSAQTAAKSCGSIHASFPSLASGTFYVKGGDADPVAVQCDMQTDGGGWTKVAQFPASFPANSAAVPAGDGGSFKLSDATINTLRPGPIRMFRFDATTSNHQLVNSFYLQTTNDWVDTAPAMGLVNRPATMMNAAGLSRSTSTLGLKVAMLPVFDTDAWGLTSGNTCGSWKLDTAAAVSCNGKTGTRCFQTGKSCSYGFTSVAVWVR